MSVVRAALDDVRQRAPGPNGYGLVAATVAATWVVAVRTSGPVHDYVDATVPVPEDLPPSKRPTVAYALGYVTEIDEEYLPTSATMLLLVLLVVAAIAYVCVVLLDVALAGSGRRLPRLDSPLPSVLAPTWPRLGATAGLVLASSIVPDELSVVDNLYWGQIMLVRALGADRETLVPVAVGPSDTTMAALALLVPLLSALAATYLLGCVGLAVARRPEVRPRLRMLRRWLADPTGPTVLGALLVGTWIASTLSYARREGEDLVHVYFPEHWILSHDAANPDPWFAMERRLALGIVVVGVAVFVGYRLALALWHRTDEPPRPARTTPLSPTWSRLAATALVVVVDGPELLTAFYGPLVVQLSKLPLSLPLPTGPSTVRWLHARFAILLGMEPTLGDVSSAEFYFAPGSGELLWPYVPVLVVVYVVVTAPIVGVRAAYRYLASPQVQERTRDDVAKEPSGASD